MLNIVVEFFICFLNLLEKLFIFNVLCKGFVFLFFFVEGRYKWQRSQI
jgi:hypothetical protein